MRDTPILKPQADTIKPIKLSFLKKVGCVFVILACYILFLVSFGNFDLEKISFESKEVEGFARKVWKVLILFIWL